MAYGTDENELTGFNRPRAGTEVTHDDIEAALAREVQPLKDDIARLERQIAELRQGPDPW